MANLTRCIAVLTRWGLGLCALLVVLVALYVSLGRQLVPLVAEYRVEVETRASAALGVPLQIGRLEGHWSGMAPVLQARDVMIGTGASAIRLDQVQVKPDVWSSLLARQVRIDHLQLSGLQIGLEQDATGKWSLNGLPAQTDQAFDPQKTLQQLQQVRRLSVLDSQVTLEPRDHAPMTLTYVGLSLHTGSAEQRLDVRLNLPDGQPLALRVNSRINAERWRDGQVQAWVDFPASDWARWLPAQWTPGWNVEQLKAGGELWVDWREQQLHSATVRLEAPRIEAGKSDQAAYPITDLTLAAWVQRNASGLEVIVDSLAMKLAGTPWQSRLHLQQFQTGEPAQERWQLQADRLELTPLTAPLDALAPLPPSAAAVLDGLRPTGAVRNLTLQLRPQATGDQRLSFAANLEQVGFNAYHGAPAAGNVSGAISGDLGQGELRLASQDFMLHLDPIFAKPWYYREANARLTYHLDHEAFTLVAPYIKVLGEEGKVAADFLIRLPFDPAVEPYMDLRVGMLDGDGRHTGKYLPAVLSPALDHWLRTAIVEGQVDQGYFQYQGSLSHAAAPYSRSITLFFKVHDAVLAFQPGWPSLSGVEGEVFVQDGDVRVQASRGQMLGTHLSNVLVRVPHVDAGKDSHLLVQGDFDGSLEDGLKILQEAPIGTGSIFKDWQGSGPLRGDLSLDVPLVKGQEPKVVVDFATDNARLKISEPQLQLSQLKGQFRFDYDKGLSAEKASAHVFDQPVDVRIFAEGQAGAPHTRIAAKGQVAVGQLADWLQFKPAIPASGDIAYQLQLDLGGADSRLSVDSSLVGVTVDLPAPLGKSAGEARPSTFGLSLGGTQRNIEARYGDLASFVYTADASALTEGRGELLVGTGSAQLPSAQGLRIRGVLDALDLGPWKDKLSGYSGGDPGGSARQVLNEIDLRVDRLTAMGMQLDAADVRLKRADSAWNLAVSSRQLTGNAQIPDRQGVPVSINMRSVRLPAPDPAVVAADDAPDQPDAPDPLADVDPRNIPAVDLRIDQLWQGEDLLGAWSMKLRPTPRGLALNDLDLGLKGLQLRGMAGWEGAPGASSSWFKGRLQGGNLADVLKAWKFAPTVTSREFTLDADGRWPGSPAWVALKRYSGSLDATLTHGQFVEIEGGAQALRVFGLLNFNSIGRRLRLDFSDLLGKGLSYDRVKGLLVASDGVYVTRTPITMTGPSTNFELNGTLDMVNDRVDAKLQVALPITNSLPIAALLVGAPAVGGALFLVDKLLGDRVARFASVDYRIEGPWKEPKMTLSKPFEKSR